MLTIVQMGRKRMNLGRYLHSYRRKQISDPNKFSRHSRIFYIYFLYVKKSQLLFSDLPVASYQPFFRHQFLQRKRPPGMQLLSGNAYLSP